jgi:hypothetical protein
MLLALFLLLLYWCRRVTVEGKVLSQSNVGVICGVHSGTWTGFPSRIRFCLIRVLSPFVTTQHCYLSNTGACTEIKSQSDTSVKSVACRLCV